MSQSVVLAVLTLLVCACLAAPRAPVLPDQYSISYTGVNDPSDVIGFRAQLFYDWTNRRQVSSYTRCLVGGNVSEVTDHPCDIIMTNNVTLTVSAFVDGLCCRLPDGDVPIPAPDCYHNYWTYDGVVSYGGGQIGLDYTDDGFHWVIDATTLQPVSFQFASGGIWNWTSDVIPVSVEPFPADVFDLPIDLDSCIQNVCPFCWFLC